MEHYQTAMQQDAQYEALSQQVHLPTRLLIQSSHPFTHPTGICRCSSASSLCSSAVACCASNPLVTKRQQFGHCCCATCLICWPVDCYYVTSAIAGCTSEHLLCAGCPSSLCWRAIMMEGQMLLSSLHCHSMQSCRTQPLQTCMWLHAMYECEVVHTGRKHVHNRAPAAVAGPWHRLPGHEQVPAGGHTLEIHPSRGRLAAC